MAVWSELVGAFKTILDVLQGVTGSYGVAIILFTVAIRLAMWPLTQRQIVSMRRMQLLQPEIQKLQKKYKNDKQKLNEEMAKFMRENNANPITGCLPTLVQLPFLYALYAVLRHSTFNNAHFLWLANLHQTDPYYILPVLSGVLTFVQTRMTTPMAAAEGPTAGTQKTMLYIMPVFIIWVTANLPSGLGLYWVATTGVAALQQWLIMRNMSTEVVAAGTDAPSDDEPSDSGRKLATGKGGGKSKSAKGQGSQGAKGNAKGKKRAAGVKGGKRKGRDQS